MAERWAPRHRCSELPHRPGDLGHPHAGWADPIRPNRHQSPPAVNSGCEAPISVVNALRPSLPTAAA